MDNYKEKLKDALEDGNTDYEVVRWIESNFPELKLKESKDEKIRKRLIDFFEDWHKNRSLCWGIAVTDILAWLEKQGQVKESSISQHEIETCKENNDSLTSKDERIRKRLIAMCQHYIECYALDQYNLDGYKEALAWLEKQDINYSLVEEIKKRKDSFMREKEKAVSSNDKLSLGARIAVLDELLVFANEKQGELTQSVTKISDKVWSKDDELNIKEIIKAIYFKYKDTVQSAGLECWLQSLKDRLSKR